MSRVSQKRLLEMLVNAGKIPPHKKDAFYRAAEDLLDARAQLALADALADEVTKGPQHHHSSEPCGTCIALESYRAERGAK